MAVADFGGACPFCAAVVPVAEQVFEMRALPDHRYTWRPRGSKAAIYAQPSGRGWAISPLDRDGPNASDGSLSIVAEALGGTRSKVRAAVLDRDGAPIVTVVAAAAPGHDERRQGTIGLLRDGAGRLVAAARSDGPTGLHLIGSDGTVLALASSAPQRRTEAEQHEGEAVSPAGGDPAAVGGGPAAVGGGPVSVGGGDLDVLSGSRLPWPETVLFAALVSLDLCTSGQLGRSVRTG
ncbi:MAG: DsbA family protein [Acidimicrobiales bacterium]